MQPVRVLDVVIEIPKAAAISMSTMKCFGQIRLDRVLYSSVHYPTD